MNKNKIIKPWILIFKAFFMCCIFFIISNEAKAQNVLKKKLQANGIETIVINGNQIFRISVSTVITDYISITSALDGEYQNEFQIAATQNDNNLLLNLEHSSFSAIADDKRNAHKVIAATLHLEIPKHLNLSIKSDIGSVHLTGEFNTLSVELSGGSFEITGMAKKAIVKTIDGDIKVITQEASIMASSNHGLVKVDEFVKPNYPWELRSINGAIRVVKQE